MPRKTVYVGDNDVPAWQAAERVAKQRGTSVSQIVSDALADYLPRLAAEPTPADRWAAIAADAA